MTPREPGTAKRIVAAIYSAAAKRIYDPLVVKGTFRLLGGRLDPLVREQGRRAVEQAAGAPILDMPVGTGYYAVDVAHRHRGIVVGVDIAEGMVRRAADVAAQRGVDNLVLVKADAHRLPFKDRCFGAVLCSNGLQVIPGLAPTVAELSRVASNGATVFVSVITVALRMVPRTAREQLPTMLRSGAEIADALSATGLSPARLERSRFATFIEMKKPVSGSRRRSDQ